MNKNSRVHSEPKDERQFCREEKSQLSKMICDVIEKNGTQKGAEILADTFFRSVENDNAEQEDKRRKRKSVFIIVLIGVIWGILLTCLLELIGRKLNLNDIVRKFLYYASVFVEVIVIIISAIFKIVRMPESTRFRQDDEGIAEGMLEWIKDLGRRLSQASGLHFFDFVYDHNVRIHLDCTKRAYETYEGFFFRRHVCHGSL